MGRDRFCCLRRMITGLATMTVERLNARVVLNTRMTLVVDPSMNHHLAVVHWSMLNRSRALISTTRGAPPIWTARGALVLLVQPCDDGMDLYAEFL